MLYLLYILGTRLASAIPRSICYRLAKFFALIQFYISRKDREVVLYNLYPIFNDKKKTVKCAKEVFINFAYYLADFFRYQKLTPDFIQKFVRISGLENINSTLSSDKGIIALTAHLGNYEFAGAVVASLGYPVVAIALPHKDKRINKFFDSRREMVNIKVISTGAGIKECFSLLRQGKILALLGDRDFSGKAHTFKMFSQYARFPRGPAFFSLKTGAPIIPAFLIRENRDYYHLIFEKPINSTGKSEKDIINSYIPILEKHIKSYPDQWYMFGKFWEEETDKDNEQS